MYSRFLEESAKITMNKKLSEASEKIYESGKLFSKIGLLFKNAGNDQNINEKIEIASEAFKRIADIEEEAFNCLSTGIK
ncbi:MAG: hypothetical protein MSIBF_00290 [Candidatus Altiarchaeales archaeon IMC4]|nr:MAG: hypothetical protein MSIBF_00290 [Candidatus Altiarchaeales archaeon IMC4]